MIKDKIENNYKIGQILNYKVFGLLWMKKLPNSKDFRDLGTYKLIYILISFKNFAAIDQSFFILDNRWLIWGSTGEMTYILV